MSFLPGILMFALAIPAAPTGDGQAIARDGKPTVGSFAKQCKTHLQSVYEAPRERSPQDLVDDASCIAYLGGYLDMAMFQFITSDFTLFCYPDGKNYDRAAKAFVDWADRNPKSLDESRFVGVSAAMRFAFPCKSSSP
jgi:hypothetical protein